MKRTYIAVEDLHEHADKCLLAGTTGDLETWGIW